jgi:hypothetical protein
VERMKQQKKNRYADVPIEIIYTDTYDIEHSKTILKKVYEIVLKYQD